MIKPGQGFSPWAHGVFVGQHDGFQAVAGRLGNGQQFGGAAERVRHVAAGRHLVRWRCLFKLAAAGDETAAGGIPIFGQQRFPVGHHRQLHRVGVEQIARFVIELDIAGRIKCQRRRKLPGLAQCGQIALRSGGVERLRCVTDQPQRYRARRAVAVSGERQAALQGDDDPRAGWPIACHNAAAKPQSDPHRAHRVRAGRANAHAKHVEHRKHDLWWPMHKLSAMPAGNSSLCGVPSCA